MKKENLDIIFISEFLEKNLANNLFEELEENIFKNKKMNIDEKVLSMPRLIKWFGDKAYAYSSIYHPAEKIPENISNVMSKINIYLMNEKINSILNSVLINYYRDGKDKINYHSDDLTQIGVEPVIASLSLGDSRLFKFKNKETKEKIEYSLHHGDLLIMKGKTQDYWQHAIIPEENKKSRINLTFRNTLYEPK